MVDQSAGLGSVMAHLYRGEMDRAVNWRQRLDQTTNWAVTIIAGILAYALSNSSVSHAIILVAIGIGIVFLIIEARRFRLYDVWRDRVRAMQENLFANALNPAGGIEQRNWREQLSRDYRDSDKKMPLPTAVAHRLQWVYLPLLVGLLFVWLFRLNGESGPLIQAAAVSNTPGWLVFTVVLAVYGCLTVIAFWPDAAAITETGNNGDRGDLGSDERDLLPHRGRDAMPRGRQRCARGRVRGPAPGARCRPTANRNRR